MAIHQLSAEENRLRDVVETIPAMTFTTSSDGSCTFVNKGWIEYTGLSIEETSGAGWQRAIHPEDLARHSEEWRIAVATGQFFEDEARFRRAADGEYLCFPVRGVPLRDRHGKIVRWYGTLTDIEDRKRAEEDLQRSQAYLAEGQRLAHTGSWAWSPDTDVRHWSEECYHVLGFDPRDGAPRLEELIQRIHPDDQPAFRQSAERAKHNQFDEELGYRIVHPDGAVRNIHSIGHPVFSPSGDLIEYTGSVIDITERKRAEEALQSLSRDLQESKSKLEEAQRITHVGYWEWDILTGRVNWSDETYRIYGLQPQERPMDLAAVREKVHPDDWEGVLRALEEALSGGARYDAECRVFRPTGEVRIIDSQGDVKRDTWGRPTLMFGTVQDITDRKRAEEALQQSESYLAEGQRLAHMGQLGIQRYRIQLLVIRVIPGLRT
jgi:PAS domain S-box-containing protein